MPVAWNDHSQVKTSRSAVRRVRTWLRRSPLLRHGERMRQVQHGRPTVAAVREQECRALRTHRLFRPRLGRSRAALQPHPVQRQACVASSTCALKRLRPKL